MNPEPYHIQSAVNWHRVSLCRLVLLLFGCIILGLPNVSFSASVELNFDGTGNLSTVQTATASVPVIISQPLSVLDSLDGIVSVSVNVASDTPLTYQWQFNGQNITGATSATLLLTNVTTANFGNYTVIITNSHGSVTSGMATLGISPNVQVTFDDVVLDNETGDWYADNGVWEVGMPTVGPLSGHSGSICAGTAMTGNVPANMSSRLISPAFTVPSVSQNPRLQFWQWFQFGSSLNETNVDLGNILILPAGATTWVTLATVSGSSGSWTADELNLSAYAGQSVQIAFQFISGNEEYGNGPGWYVDDVTLVTGAISTLVPNVPDTFASGPGDWSADNGVWSVGTPTVGPKEAYNGANTFGTAMTGNVPANMSSRLISPAFTVPAASQNPRLQFWQWFQFGSSLNEANVDQGNILVLPAGATTWVTLATVSGSSGSWTADELNLSAYAGQSVQIAFQFISGNEEYGSGPGWYVDDVTLVTGAVSTLVPNVPDTFASGPGDWSADNGVWSVGTPTVGPKGAYSGTTTAGTAMTGNVPANMSSRLISPAFTVPAASQNPRLQFWQWFQFGISYNETNVDLGNILILPAGATTWVTLATVSGSSGSWTEDELNLSAYAGQSVQIAFQFISGNEGNGNGPGWYVDDVTLVTGAISTLVPNVPDTFASGPGDWSADNGVWSVGTPTVGPKGAYSGSTTFGTAMTGNVPANMSSRLISPAFTVPVASLNPRLQFWQWFQFGISYNETNVDLGNILILPAGATTWVTLATVNGSSGSWTADELNLSAYAGQSVQIAFQFISGNEGNGSGPGWYVDDVTLVTGAISTLVPNVPDTFASGPGDWSADNGVWSVGTPTVGPKGAHSGTTAAGTAMIGNAPANMSSRLISPAFTVPAAIQNPQLQFWQWFQFGSSYNEANVDLGHILILPAGATTWVTLATVSGSSGSWTEDELNLSAYAGQSVQIAFQFISGNEGNGSGPGWYVDDVTLVALVATSPVIVVQQPAGTTLASGSSTVSFGEAIVGGGGNPTETITIENAGTANLTLGSITFGGTNPSDFSVTSSPASPVSPAGATTFTVQFAPGALGSRSATLQIASNDPVTSAFTVNLTGTGFAETTLPATNVLSNSAALHGTANPNGLATTAYFQYGTSTSYGSSTAANSIGSGMSAVAVSANIAGLLPGMTYYYRTVETNSGGTFYGGDQSFSTPNPYLASLVLSAGKLAPAFAPGTTAYLVRLPASQTSLTITPTLADSTASMTVNSVAVPSGTSSGSIGLSLGRNTVAIVVTAQDGVTTETYTLTVLRTADPDLNGDGNADILFQNTDIEIAVWYMNGSGAATVAASISTANLGDWVVVGVADMNNDGNADILFQNTEGQIAVWYMNGSGAATSTAFISSANLGDWKVVGVADMNNDGNADILFQNTEGQIAVWYMNGSGAVTSTAFISSANLGDWKVVGVADMNNDGNADILFQNTEGQIAVWYMNGSGSVISAASITTANLGDWVVVGVADMNNDGNADILFQNTEGQIAIWYMNGSGTVTSAASITTANLGAWRVR